MRIADPTSLVDLFQFSEFDMMLRANMKLGRASVADKTVYVDV